MAGSEIPMIFPLLLTGVLVGTLLRRTNIHIGWRMILLVSLLGGLGNVAHMAALYYFQGPTARPSTVTPSPGQEFRPTAFPTSTSLTTTSPAYYLSTSFIAGVVVVLLVFLAAVLTLRLRGRVVVEE